MAPQCSLCDGRAIWLSPRLCKEHYTESFESRIRATIDQFKLVSKSTRICVAASGGKDSLVTLHVLAKFGFSVTALAIDEGIAGYREHTLKDLKDFCSSRDIELRVVSFAQEVGKSLDHMLAQKPLHPCTVCGTFRRYLLNKFAHEYDVLATGHNADDEAQAVLMNLLRANTQLFTRTGPKTANLPGLVQRVKPLYFLTEKEIMTYAIIHGIKSDFTECPNVSQSYRSVVRDLLNEQEVVRPGTKRNILFVHDALKQRLLSSSESVGVPDRCSSCGEPSTGPVCAACRMKQMILS